MNHSPAVEIQLQGKVQACCYANFAVNQEQVTVVLVAQGDKQTAKVTLVLSLSVSLISSNGQWQNEDSNAHSRDLVAAEQTDRTPAHHTTTTITTGSNYHHHHQYDHHHSSSADGSCTTLPPLT